MPQPERERPHRRWDADAIHRDPSTGWATWSGEPRWRSTEAALERLTGADVYWLMHRREAAPLSWSVGALGWSGFCRGRLRCYFVGHGRPVAEG